MIIPLGSVGERVRRPALTLAIIVVNCLVHLAVYDRVREDEKAMREPTIALVMVESMIELRHRERGSMVSEIFGLRRAEAADRERFWWRFRNGLVVPRTDPTWIEWDRAHAAYDEAHHRTLFYRWGWRRDDPSALGLFTHAFLHAGFMHLLGNMLFLWAVGAAVEDAWGRKWFALLYACGIVGSALAAFVYMPAGLGIPGVGASGAVAAVMGAMAVRHFRRPMRIFSIFPMPGVYRVATGWLLVPWVLWELVSAASPEASGSGVLFGAHVAGFVVGAGLAAGLRLGRVESQELAPQREADRLSGIKQAALKEAEALFSRGRSPDGVAKLREAIQADPDDVALRFRLTEALGLLGRGDEQRAEGVELLARLWKLGQKERFASTWGWLASRGHALPPALAHRVAPLQEAADPHEAASSYAAALQGAPEDPLAGQSYRRYGDLLERLGEAAKAAQVRELAQAHERRRRDRGLTLP